MSALLVSKAATLLTVNLPPTAVQPSDANTQNGKHAFVVSASAMLDSAMRGGWKIVSISDNS